MRLLFITQLYRILNLRFQRLRPRLVIGPSQMLDYVAHEPVRITSERGITK